MLEKIFQKSVYNKENPIILKECTLFFNLRHFDIDDTYIFQTQKEYPYSTVGELWINGKMKTEYNNVGYFSTVNYSLNHFYISNYFIQDEPDGISIIGYYKGERYCVSGISINKDSTNFNEGYAVKFGFLEMKKLLK